VEANGRVCWGKMEVWSCELVGLRSFAEAFGSCIYFSGCPFGGLFFLVSVFHFVIFSLFHLSSLCMFRFFLPPLVSTFQ